MANHLRTEHFYQFGCFQLDPDQRLLLRDGQLVPLTPKVVDTLIVLVERAGELLDKEVLMQAVWPGTFVEESNLAHNISVLRKTLGNTPDGQPYIETHPKRGYRFVGAVTERVEEGSESTGLAQVAVKSRAPVGPLTAAAVLVLLGILSISIAWRVRWFAPKPELVQRQLTSNPLDNGVYRAAISPDGRYVAYTDLGGLYLRLIETGETRPIALPPGVCFR